MMCEANPLLTWPREINVNFTAAIYRHRLHTPDAITVRMTFVNGGARVRERERFYSASRRIDAEIKAGKSVEKQKPQKRI